MEVEYEQMGKHEDGNSAVVHRLLRDSFATGENDQRRIVLGSGVWVVSLIKSNAENQALPRERQ